jgi:DNA polymerase III epsilon subunit-like protein
MIKPYIVIDFETSGVDANVCQPVQLAAVVIDPYRLELIEGAEFSSYMKPEVKDWNEFIEEESVSSCIAWHAKNYKVKPEEIVDKWKDAPNQKDVWLQFSNFVNKFNPKKTDWFAPIAAGANIRNFDLTIVKRLNDLYNIKTMFWKRDVEDIVELSYHFLTYRSDCPSNFRMDTLREYFKVPEPKLSVAHDALQDTYDESFILIKYLKMKKHVAERWSIPK